MFMRVPHQLNAVSSHPNCAERSPDTLPGRLRFDSGPHRQRSREPESSLSSPSRPARTRVGWRNRADPPVAGNSPARQPLNHPFVRIQPPPILDRAEPMRLHRARRCRRPRSAATA